LGWLGLGPGPSRPQLFFLIFFRLDLTQSIQAGLNLASPAWSLAQANDPAG